MLSGTVTNRYTEGLFAAARAHGVVAAVDASLRRVADALAAHPELKTILEHPVITPEAKANVIQGVFGDRLEPLAMRFLRILFDRGRAAYVEAIARRFHELAEAAEGRVRVRVESAMPLPEEQTRALEQALSSALGKQVRADIAIRPDLIAGVRVQMGHRVLDATVAGALDQFAEQLRHVASRKGSSV